MQSLGAAGELPTAFTAGSDGGTSLRARDGNAARGACAGLRGDRSRSSSGAACSRGLFVMSLNYVAWRALMRFFLVFCVSSRGSNWFIDTVLRAVRIVSCHEVTVP
ncbi:unnamed protein product [Arctia plantaginis]|uniref:Uncharacterized protein n=1 Tax=Arctia plantaginis TaxID=874455 RepID=A0A8S0YRE4_ARCPL|nr:unnamed protein product [Arctia plantaginis]